MTGNNLEQLSLWIETLASRPDDDFEPYRSRLRVALLQMRDNVIPFVRSIHQNLEGLTVHDESHLDALWQMVDILLPKGFELNPVEAFVFGAAVLLHDTAMSAASYQGGIEELKNLDLWKDYAAVLNYKNEENLDKGADKAILFNVLRELHAQQAENLIHIRKARPGRTEIVYILEDNLLRDSLGGSIGRIAHSHHWDASDLPDRLNSTVGGIPGFPTEWTINEVKIACLLRAADAIHIDSRRAPTMLYCLTPVGGVSELHWRFQNKLNAVTADEGRLVFTSGPNFEVEDAAAWWLAYDTIRMIDGEIKKCNAILGDVCGSQLTVKTVAGSEGPKYLSKYIKVKGWSPVDAEVKVSDPVNLAKTLGGKNLYGSNALAPIREILQNSVDALRARRELEGRPLGWGKIKISLDMDRDDPTQIWLHVDDQGVGMSERILTGPLIDFGATGWGGAIIRDEFPGLQSKKVKHIGKFGIGFFSIFLLGDQVRVVSKRFDHGANEGRALVFDKLSRRPLVRLAETGELPLDFSTRVSVCLDKQIAFSQRSEPGASSDEAVLFDHSSSIRRLICALDVDVLP